MNDRVYSTQFPEYNRGLPMCPRSGNELRSQAVTQAILNLQSSSELRCLYVLLTRPSSRSLGFLFLRNGQFDLDDLRDSSNANILWFSDLELIITRSG